MVEVSGLRIVVVGATGNVGSAVIRRLQRAEGVSELVGISRRTPASAPPFAGVSWHAVDVSKPESRRTLTAAFAGADAVVHLAWLLQPNRDERTMAATNVDGLVNVLAAVRSAGVPQIVVASSVGAYSPGPKNRAVDESWPTGGIHTSHYSRFKAANERILDAFEAENPDIVVTRLRPGLVMQRSAGAELQRLFLGPLVPTRWLTRVRLPVLPLPRRAISQVVHADDLADAFWRAIDARVSGAFNIAADPVVTPTLVAQVLGTRHIGIRTPPIRALLSLAWRAHLVPVDPGWLDIAVTVPVMSTERARTVLGWTPTTTAEDALAEAIQGVADHRNLAASPQLRG